MCWLVALKVSPLFIEDFFIYKQNMIAGKQRILPLVCPSQILILSVLVVLCKNYRHSSIPLRKHNLDGGKFMVEEYFDLLADK